MSTRTSRLARLGLALAFLGLGSACTHSSPEPKPTSHRGQQDPAITAQQFTAKLRSEGFDLQGDVVYKPSSQLKLSARVKLAGCTSYNLVGVGGSSNAVFIDTNLPDGKGGKLRYTQPPSAAVVQQLNLCRKGFPE